MSQEPKPIPEPREPTWEEKRKAQEARDFCIMCVLGGIWMLIGVAVFFVFPIVTMSRVDGLRKDVARMMEALNLTEVHCVAERA